MQRIGKIKFKHINQLVQSINTVLQDSTMFLKAKLKCIVGPNAEQLFLEGLLMLGRIIESRLKSNRQGLKDYGDCRWHN